MPQAQARVALSQPGWAPNGSGGRLPWGLGLWAAQGKQSVNALPLGPPGIRGFDVQAYGFDVNLPLAQRVVLRGEGWTGRGLGDLRGGIGQTLNPFSGREIGSTGGWAELGFRPTDRYGVGGGFGIDNPVDGAVVSVRQAGRAVPATGITHNRVFWIYNRFNLGSGLDAGVDWMVWHTSFRGGVPSGNSNRWNLWLRQQF